MVNPIPKSCKLEDEYIPPSVQIDTETCNKVSALLPHRRSVTHVTLAVYLLN